MFDNKEKKDLINANFLVKIEFLGEKLKKISFDFR